MCQSGCERQRGIDASGLSNCIRKRWRKSAEPRHSLLKKRRARLGPVLWKAWQKVGLPHGPGNRARPTGTSAFDDATPRAWNRTSRWYIKLLAGGGVKIVNRTVAGALSRLAYKTKEIERASRTCENTTPSRPCSDWADHSPAACALNHRRCSTARSSRTRHAGSLNGTFDDEGRRTQPFIRQTPPPAPSPPQNKPPQKKKKKKTPTPKTGALSTPVNLPHECSVPPMS